MSPGSTYRRSYSGRRERHAEYGLAVRRLRFVLTAALLASSASLQAQSTVGDWNLSSWAYVGKNISATTVTSDGITPVGLSATINSPVTFFLSGASDGIASLAIPFLAVPVAATYSYSLSQSFFLSAGVNFGMPSSQTQFVNALTDNGVGIRINSQEANYIAHYNLTISLSGGGVFASFGGDYDGFSNLAGLGTSTITLEWNANASIDGVASFDGIQISGGVTGFSVMHDVAYFNSSTAPLVPVNIVELKINTTDSIADLPGDHNQNGTVDAADYVTWRKSPNHFGGVPGGYNTWRANFGRTTGSGLAAGENSVPEPASVGLLGLCAAVLLLRWRHGRQDKRAGVASLVPPDRAVGRMAQDYQG